MSLISEALKEAQRERSERFAPKTAAAVGDSFFPYPASAKKRHGSNRTFLIGASVFAVVLIGGSVAWRLRSTPSETRALPKAPAVTQTPVPPTVAPESAPAAAAKDSVRANAVPRTAAKSESQTTSKPASNVTANVKTPAKSPVAEPPAPKSVASEAGAPLKSAATPVTDVPATKPAAVDSIKATAPVALPNTSTKNAGIRVVVDASTLRPGDSLFSRAFTEHQRGNLDAAADLYEKAIAHPPVTPELYNNYGALLATQGKYAAAKTMYNLGIKLNPQDPRLWTNLGDAQRSQGRRADAMSAYAEAAKLDPSSIPVKIRLAGEYLALGDTADARRGYEEAVRVAPRDPEAHYNFGSYLATQHDFRGAARELQSFIDLAPGKYAQSMIDQTKAYVSNLRKQYP